MKNKLHSKLVNCQNQDIEKLQQNETKWVRNKNKSKINEVEYMCKIKGKIKLKIVSSKKA